MSVSKFGSSYKLEEKSSKSNHLGIAFRLTTHGHFDFRSKKIENLHEPEADSDGVTKRYCDDIFDLLNGAVNSLKEECETRFDTINHLLVQQKTDNQEYTRQQILMTEQLLNENVLKVVNSASELEKDIQQIRADIFSIKEYIRKQKLKERELPY
jgi:hypothetical protein